MRGRTSLRDVARSSGVGEALVRRVRRGGKALGDLEARRKLAQGIGVTLATVGRWKRTGVPLARLGAVAALVADREAFTKASRAEQQKVRKLVSRARREGVIPVAKPSGTRRFGGPRAIGEKTIFHLNRYLDYDLLTTIDSLTREAPRGPRYIVTITAVEAGITGKVRGYGGTITQKLGKGAENMAFATAITSGTWTTKQGALDALFDKLREAIRDADALVFIIDLWVFSYRYRPG